MARLARLAVAGHTHLVLQRGHSGNAVFADDTDRQAYLSALKEAAAAHQVAVHAYTLLDKEVRLLLTPAHGAGLSRTMQAQGRRYVSAYNRRHGRSGTLWDGRYRCAVVQSGAPLLAALLWVDNAELDLPGLSMSVEGSPPPAANSSAAHRSGASRSVWIIDPPEYWALGNTPFDREARYRDLLASGVAPAQAQALRHAAWGGWALGSPTFVAQMAEQSARPASPQPRGRPRRSAL